MEMLIDGHNVRVTNGKLWYPRLDSNLKKKLDSLYERTSPQELMWDVNKPKNTEEPPVLEPVTYTLADDMDLDGVLDDSE